MKKIILHWTAGSHAPTFFDRQFYHFLIDGEGNVHRGIYPPEANLNVKSGKYAAHCGGGNTGAIGVALCAMAGFTLSPLNAGRFPIKKIQLDALARLCAQLCRRYSIPVTPKTILTHYEFGLQNPLTSSAGKPDICHLPPHPEILPHDVGKFLRAKIRSQLACSR